MKLRCLIVFATLESALAQSAPTTDAPKLTENFSFTLNQHRDEAIRHTVETMMARDEMQRTLGLKDADASIFSRSIDLLRFVPFKLSGSDSKADDFFTPNYMRSDYNRPTSEPHLFNTR
jgi:hypothetical protein